MNFIGAIAFFMIICNCLGVCISFGISAEHKEKHHQDVFCECRKGYMNPVIGAHCSSVDTGVNWQTV